MVQNCRVNFTDGQKPKQLQHVSYRYNKKDIKLIESEISKMLEQNIIKEVEYHPSLYLSPIFLREKKSGGYRLILNLKNLNQFVPYEHFKMEMFENLLTLIRPGDWMTSIDLKNAYYCVPIHEDDQIYFSFEFQNKYYSYTCMPNGWACAPRLFTKLMKPIFNYLRSRGFTSSYFIDDSLQLGRTRHECKCNYDENLSLLQFLGWYINFDKSISNPTQNILHMGFYINTVDMIVYLPEEKKDKIVKFCSDLRNSKKKTIRFVARVIGILVSTFSAVEYGRMHYRNLEKCKIAALKESQGRYDAVMSITKPMKEELDWWIDNINDQCRKIIKPKPEFIIQTDSSKLGWGCVIDEEIFNGRWTEQERNQHINILEMKAILFGLKACLHKVKNKHLKILSDSTTAVTYINNMGGLNSLECNDLAIEIWNLAVANNIWLSSEFIPGSENQADEPSRKFHDDLEWMLCPSIFRKICKQFVTPNIDLFASRLNQQLKNYCSWQRDPFALHINAFSISWNTYKCSYLFPPFCIISRCLQKIQDEEAQAIIVAPLWPNQIWFPNLLKLLIADPVILPDVTQILSLPHSNSVHPLGKKLRLIACHISGDNSQCREYLEKLQTSSWPHGELRHRRSTTPTSVDGLPFAVQGIEIPFHHL